MTCFRELSDFIIGTGTMKSCISNDGTLPLQMAIRSRQPSSIIKILLPPDLALWNSVDRRYHSVLHDLFDPRSIERNRRPFYDASSRPVAPLPTFTSEALATLDVLLSTDGINVDVKDPNGNTPLLTMFSNDLQYGHRDYRIKMLKQLLQSGADINACNDDGFTPLHMVIWHGNQEELKEVLLYKPDLNAQTRSGDTAFHLLMGGPNRHVPVQPPSQVVGKLQSIMIYAKEISASSNHDSGRIEGLEIANKRGHLPIHVACEKRNLEAVRFLLNSGYVPDVNIRTLQSRSTPLHFVSCWFEPELSITLDLLDRGADVNATNSMKITPLHDAATAGYLEVLKALIERGARSNVKSRLGYTPWMCAAMNSQSEAMVYLKECAEAEHLNNLDRPLEPKNETREEDDRGSSSSENEDEDQDGDEDNPASDYKGLPKHKIGQKQAMRKALRNSEYGLCQMLLETGFDPNQILTTKNKETALHLATSPDLIRLLLQHGAQVNSVDVWGCEPIHESAREGRHENMKILIKAGAKIDARNYWMTTSLHWAASNDHLETVQAIIELAETESKDRDSKISKALIRL
jgi:ankyrin